MNVSQYYRTLGPTQVGLSGGRSSGKMLHEMLQACDGQLPADCFVTFENTGKERKETLDFVDQMSREWGVHVHWIEWCGVYGHGNGRDWRLVDYATASRNSEPFDLMLRYYDDYRRVEKNEPPILPNVVNRMCSDRMKIQGSVWFMRDQLGFGEWDAFLGYRADEQSRYAKAMLVNEKGVNRYETVCPMYRAGVTKADVKAFWDGHSFDLGIDSDEGNCDGCFLKHENKLLRTFRAEPWRADWWSAHEVRTGQKFIKNGMTYKEMKFVAIQMNKQLPLELPMRSEDEESVADCICGD